jgi:hypothetical protein
LIYYYNWFSYSLLFIIFYFLLILNIVVFKQIYSLKMMNRFGKSVVAKLLPNENKKAAQAAAQAIAELELIEKRDLLKLTKVFVLNLVYFCL